MCPSSNLSDVSIFFYLILINYFSLSRSSRRQPVSHYFISLTLTMQIRSMMVASRFLHSCSRGNGIGTEGAKAVAGALMVNDAVHTVWLQSVSPKTPSLLRGRNFLLMTRVSLLQNFFFSPAVSHNRIFRLAMGSPDCCCFPALTSNGSNYF